MFVVVAPNPENQKKKKKSRPIITFAFLDIISQTKSNRVSSSQPESVGVSWTNSKAGLTCLD
jgi:hypothetical protein